MVGITGGRGVAFTGAGVGAAGCGAGAETGAGAGGGGAGIGGRLFVLSTAFGLGFRTGLGALGAGVVVAGSGGGVEADVSSGTSAGGGTGAATGGVTGWVGVTDAVVTAFWLCCLFLNHHQPPIPADATKTAPIRTRRSTTNLVEVLFGCARTGGTFGMAAATAAA